MEQAVEATKKRLDEILQRMQTMPEMSKEALQEIRVSFFTLLGELKTAYEEIQTSNEVLVQTKYQLEKEHQRYQELFYLAPEAYLETDNNGRILAANEAALALFNLPEDELIGKSLSQLTAEEDRQAFSSLIMPPQQASGVELTMQSQRRPSFTALISLIPVKDSSQRAPGLRWLIHDISRQKSEQAALAASEERFHTIFTHSHLGMLLTDLSGRIIESNPAIERIVGYIREELLGLEIQGLVHPKDREDVDQVQTEILDQAQTGRTIESRYLTKNDQEIWVRQTISALPNMHGEPVYFFYQIENITQQKITDEELAEMKRRMINSIESERLHLAQELHDGPIQDLYSAVFKLTELPANDGSEHENIKETQHLIKQVAGTLRVICGDLRPPTLSNFGLDRAIQTHAEQLQDQNKGMQIKLATDRDDRLLSQDVRLGLFRIYQQCMANTIRHAKATEVIVRLEISEEDVVLMVEDNGVGFEPPVRLVDLLRTGHYGLAGIAERVESLRGSLMIDSGPGNGTRVTVEVPRNEIPSERS